MTRTLLVAVLFFTLLGCGQELTAIDDAGDNGLADAGADAGAEDLEDAGADGGSINTLPDAGFDGGSIDADAGTDAGTVKPPSDAGTDAGRADAGGSCGPACQCGTSCLVPANWDDAWDVGTNGYATTYVRDLAEELSKKLYPSVSNWNRVLHGYLSPQYAHYSVKNPAYTPPMYRRHVGWDNARPNNTPVYSLTEGQVTFRQVVDEGYNNVILIREKKNGVFQDRWWTYGHIVPAAGITVGANVVEGQRIGAVDEYPGTTAHIHLSVHSTNWQAEIIDPTPPIEWGQHWGMAKGVTQALAETTAITYTVHPLHAYALYKGYDVTR